MTACVGHRKRRKFALTLRRPVDYSPLWKLPGVRWKAARVARMGNQSCPHGFAVGPVSAPGGAGERIYVCLFPVTRFATGPVGSGLLRLRLASA